MTAVIIGAGNIGRGFIGQIMYEGGYDVCFVDVSEKVVNELNLRHEYPLDIVKTGESRRIIIKNVSAVNGNDKKAAARAIAGCDICVTCVGANAIRYIVPNLAAGIKLRYAENGAAKPLNLLICENLMDADAYIRSLLAPELSAAELSGVGLVETSVGRMVPLPDPLLLANDPLLVRAEEYPILPCDRDAFVGEIPKIKNVTPVSPFRFIIERKLYIHNMGHAVCAYLGMHKGYALISEAISDAEIRDTVRKAMLESASALSKRFDKPISELIEYIDDLISRFGNAALKDSCSRVGADIPRKLAKSDRLTGAAMSVIETGGHPISIATGAAAAFAKYLSETPSPISLAELTGVSDNEYTATILNLFKTFAG